MKLHIPIIPQPKQSVRAFASKNGRVMFHKDPVKAQYQAELRAMVYRQLPPDFVPWTNCAVIIRSLIITFPYTKGISKKKIAEAENGSVTLFKISRPDIDNLLKSLFDAMSGMVYMDDSQVMINGPLYKVYGKVPGFCIEIEEYKQ